MKIEKMETREEKIAYIDKRLSESSKDGFYEFGDSLAEFSELLTYFSGVDVFCWWICKYFERGKTLSEQSDDFLIRVVEIFQYFDEKKIKN